MGLSCLLSCENQPMEVSYSEYQLLESGLRGLERYLTEKFLHVGYDSLVSNEYRLGIKAKHKPILKIYREAMMENYFINGTKIDSDYGSKSPLKTSDKLNKYPSFSYFAHLTKFYQVQTGDRRKYRSPIQMVDIFKFVDTIPKIKFVFHAYSYENEPELKKAWFAAFKRQAQLDAWLARARRKAQERASKYGFSGSGDGGGGGYGGDGGGCDGGGDGGGGE